MSEIVEEAVCLSVCLGFSYADLCKSLPVWNVWNVVDAGPKQAKKRSAIEAALAKNAEPLRVWKSRRSTAAKFPETHSINRIYTDQLL